MRDNCKYTHIRLHTIYTPFLVTTSDFISLRILWPILPCRLAKSSSWRPYPRALGVGSSWVWGSHLHW